METDLDLDDFDYDLPPDRIAQHPATERDGARLLLLNRADESLVDGHVRELGDALRPGDLLVVNATRVVPARLRGRKETGGSAEALILGSCDGSSAFEADAVGRTRGADRRHYRALVRSRGRLRVGQKYHFGPIDRPLDAEIAELAADGEVILAIPRDTSPYDYGEMPLPPYIHRSRANPADEERYQTTYARVPGAVAAPTAGLHLSASLLADLERREIGFCEIVLHIGAGTFRPVRPEDLRSGRLHAEAFELGDAAADRIAQTRAQGGRVVAVGTTSARVLETCAHDDGTVRAASGETELFLMPGARFRATDALLTNFHLPRSSLLMLVAAFAGHERVKGAYAHAVRSGYRFYSYGDAMLVL